MISWEEYLTILVDTFRQHYDRLTKEEKLEAQLNTTFVKPCQIELFSFKKPRRDMLLVSFDPKRPDKEFVINDKIELDCETYFLRRAQSDAVIREHSKTFIDETKRKSTGLIWLSLRENMSVYFFWQPTKRKS